MSGQRYHIGPGAASLLMIVVALCLTILSILTWTSAQAALRLSQRNQEMISSYYTADACAQERLARVDEVLLAARTGAADEAAYWDAVEAGLGEIADWEDGRIFFSEDAGAMRTLAVEIEVADMGQPARYRVVSWGLVDDMPWDDAQLEEIWIG